MTIQQFLADPEETQAIGSEFARHLLPGDVVLLHGELGAGKTTFVRGTLLALGHKGAVRSPSFPILLVYELEHRVVHADLYRVGSSQGTGLEDEIGEAICLIEWSDRLEPSLLRGLRVWEVRLTVQGEGRQITIEKKGTVDEAAPVDQID